MLTCQALVVPVVAAKPHLQGRGVACRQGRGAGMSRAEGVGRA